MINISDELNAATEQGVLGRASQIKDTTQNKMQSQINSEVQTALGQRPDADTVAAMIAGAIQPAEKEIVNVLTYSATAPESPEEGDMYINSETNQLLEYVYDEQEQESAWEANEPSTAVIYITDDTQYIYIWNGEEFVDRTGEIVDNTIYVNDLVTDLEEVTTPGIYTVCYTRGSAKNWYTLIVSISRRMVRPTPITTTTQTLSNQSGWWQRRKVGGDNWSEWSENLYVYQDEYNKLRKVAAAGIVL